MNGELQSRLADIRGRIESACRRVGRDPAGVRLLPVTKTFPPETVTEAAALGLTAFGENRVQEARQKIPLCPGHLTWHLIGHLQTNKAREAVRLFDMIHAVDSWRLLEVLERMSDEEGRRLTVCLEVNVSGERSKFGLAPETVPDLLARAGGLSRVQVVGVMTIPPIAAEPEEARPFFRRLRELRDRWQADTGLALPELSMGMSHDFEMAVEEGATWVRVGTLLFGKRPKLEVHDPV